jgi:hypothetical protein
MTDYPEEYPCFIARLAIRVRNRYRYDEQDSEFVQWVIQRTLDHTVLEAGGVIDAKMRLSLPVLEQERG